MCFGTLFVAICIHICSHFAFFHDRMASKQHTHKVDKRRNECGNVCLVCKKYRFLKPRSASHEPHPSTITNTCLIAFLQVSSQFLVLEGLKSHTLCPSPAFLKTRYSTTEYIGKISSTYNFTTSSIWQKWALSRQMLHYKPFCAKMLYYMRCGSCLGHFLFFSSL